MQRKMVKYSTDKQGDPVLTYVIPGGADEHLMHMKSIVRVAQSLPPGTEVGLITPLLHMLESMLPTEGQLEKGIIPENE